MIMERNQTKPRIGPCTYIAVLATLLIANACALSPAQVQYDAAALARVEAILLRDDRNKFDLEKDPYRKPVDMIKFLNVQTGMTVLDVGSAAGYSAEIFSAAVGPTGTVYAQNNKRATKLQKGAFIRSLRARIKDDRLPNMQVVIWEMEDIPLRDQVDLAFWGNNLHDHYNRGGTDKAVAILQRIRSSLKPGGRLGVVDHIGLPGADNRALHRIEPVVIEELLQKAGFTVIATSTLYNNPEDAHNLNVFDDAIYRRSDRHFVLAQK